MAQTHWKRLQNPDYLGVYAINQGEEPIVTIAKITREMITGENGKKEEETVAHFKEGVKPLILNVTNQKAISKLFGTPYIEEWVGKRIQLYVKKEKAFGEVMDVLRVKPTKQAQEKPKNTICTDCNKPIPPHQGAPAEAIAQAYINKYGVPLCYECGQARKANDETEQ